MDASWRKCKHGVATCLKEQDSKVTAFTYLELQIIIIIDTENYNISNYMTRRKAPTHFKLSIIIMGQSKGSADWDPQIFIVTFPQ